MSSIGSVGSRYRRLVPWAIGAAAFLGLALAYAPEMSAQGKKTDPKAKTTKDDKDKGTKEKKEDPRPEPTIPKITDVMASSSGGVEQVSFINEQIAKAWKDNK